jgi:methionine aminopeptidase
VIQGVISQCVAGALVRDLCSLGDRLVLEETAKVFKKEKDVKKGIAFPTCVSVNNCVCHFSPLASDTDVELNDGDVVKM